MVQRFSHTLTLGLRFGSIVTLAKDFIGSQPCWLRKGHKMFSKFLFTLCGVVLLSGGALAEQITCKVDGSSSTYRIDIDWTKEVSSISFGETSKSYRKLYKNAAAVRNNSKDLAFLTEGTPKEWVGSQNKCGVYPTMYFDLQGVGGKRVGTVETSYKVASRKCRIRASDTGTTIETLTCG